ncbi:MAG: prolyl oligopeptidase family serine peptidase [Phycisphaerae bacterium]|nr:prolyl oligopeptidase family serine peptidase [Phycisphaerae bacterium]
MKGRWGIASGFVAGAALLLCGVAGCGQPAGGDQAEAHAKTMSKTGFIEKSVALADGTTRKYVVFIPHGYTPKKKWPCILFLHGAGERGEDNEAQVRVGIAAAIRRQETDFGFIVILPQCPEEPGWWTGESEKAYALAALTKTRRGYSVDSKRIYLTGLSMGGYGTWTMALEHPKLWAAIVPICGKGDPEQAGKIANLPCWCFHGDQDDAVTVQHSRDMIEALKQAGGSPRYTEYKGVGHNSWDRAYDTEELYTWMLDQQAK